MAIFIRTESIGTKLHRMLMFNDGEYIGEYERSREADIERKKAEIFNAQAVLLALFQKHGELCVRWDGKARKKSVRAGGVEVGIIPKSMWKTPSWQQRTKGKLEGNQVVD